MSTEAPERELPALFGESQAYYLVAFAPADSSTMASSTASRSRSRDRE